MEKNILRILDANFNRSREGLRVCEDIARFILNSSLLTKELKMVRHSISNIIKGTSASIVSLSAARDVAGDSGQKIDLMNAMTRADCLDIFSANMERTKESLRVLEEFYKLIDKGSSARLSRLRFRVYDIEKRSIKKISSLRNIR